MIPTGFRWVSKECCDVCKYCKKIGQDPPEHKCIKHDHYLGGYPSDTVCLGFEWSKYCKE
jgi:hypothetical protein